VVTSRIIICLATLSTSHFDFTAFGLDEMTAKLALYNGVRKHLAQRGVGAEEQILDFWDDYEDSVHLTPLIEGECLRDWEEI